MESDERSECLICVALWIRMTSVSLRDTKINHSLVSLTFLRQNVKLAAVEEIKAWGM